MFFKNFIKSFLKNSKKVFINIFPIVKMTDALIASYYNDPLKTGNLRVLYNNLRRDGFKITQKTISNWLKRQPYKQSSTKYVSTGYYIPVEPRQEFQIDLLYFIEPNSQLKQYQKYDSISKKSFRLNKGYKYGLVMIDIFTKYAQVGLMKTKRADECLDVALRLFNKMGTPKSLYMDEGSEFLGEFLKTMEDMNIKCIYTMTHASFAERFIRTFKNRLYPYMHSVGTKTYFNIVDKIVENYNNSYHSVIKMTPNEAVKRKNEKLVRFNIIQAYLKKKKRLRKQRALRKGDIVRYLVKRDVFSKDYEPSYSKNTAIVMSLDSNENPYVKLDNGKEFLPNELLLVEKPVEKVKAVNNYKEGTLEDHLDKVRGTVAKIKERRVLRSDKIKNKLRGKETEYEVEKIVDESKDRYRVRWVGYLPQDDTWELKKNLKKDAPLIVEDWQKLKKK
jgi:hypothetical protein